MLASTTPSAPSSFSFSIPSAIFDPGLEVLVVALVEDRPLPQPDERLEEAVLVEARVEAVGVVPASEGTGRDVEADSRC